MHVQQEIGPGAGAKSVAEDFLVAPFGLATNFLIGLLLWWIEARFGFAFYTWTFWFVVPVGALFAGFAGEQCTNRSEEHTSELQSRGHLVCRLLLEKKKNQENLECQSMETCG